MGDFLETKKSDSPWEMLELSLVVQRDTCWGKAQQLIPRWTFSTLERKELYTYSSPWQCWTFSLLPFISSPLHSIPPPHSSILSSLILSPLLSPLCYYSPPVSFLFPSLSFPYFPSLLSFVSFMCTYKPPMRNLRDCRDLGECLIN